MLVWQIEVNTRGAIKQFELLFNAANAAFGTNPSFLDSFVGQQVNELLMPSARWFSGKLAVR